MEWVRGVEVQREVVVSSVETNGMSERGGGLAGRGGE